MSGDVSSATSFPFENNIKAANTTYPTTNNRTYPTRKIQILGDCRCKTLEIA
jgi:hypothetical protein